MSRPEMRNLAALVALCLAQGLVPTASAQVFAGVGDVAGERSRLVER